MVTVGSLDEAANELNSILGQDFVKITLSLILGVFGGYTLNPVPPILKHLFETSLIFKFLILFLAGCVGAYPLKRRHLLIIPFCSALVLILFEMARKLPAPKA